MPNGDSSHRASTANPRPGTASGRKDRRRRIAGSAQADEGVWTAGREATGSPLTRRGQRALDRLLTMLAHHWDLPRLGKPEFDSVVEGHCGTHKIASGGPGQLRPCAPIALPLLQAAAIAFASGLHFAESRPQPASTGVCLVAQDAFSVRVSI